MMERKGGAKMSHYRKKKTITIPRSHGASPYRLRKYVNTAYEYNDRT